jgi:hypothetical protein
VNLLAGHQLRRVDAQAAAGSSPVAQDIFIPVAQAEGHIQRKIWTGTDAAGAACKSVPGQAGGRKAGNGIDRYAICRFRLKQAAHLSFLQDKK